MDRFAMKGLMVAGTVSAIMALGYVAEKFGFVGGAPQQQARRPGQQRSAQPEMEDFDERTFIDSFLQFLEEIQSNIDSSREFTSSREVEQMFMVIARTYQQVKHLAGMLDNIQNPELAEKKVYAIKKLQQLMTSLTSYSKRLEVEGARLEKEQLALGNGKEEDELNDIEDEENIHEIEEIEDDAEFGEHEHEHEHDDEEHEHEHDDEEHESIAEPFDLSQPIVVNEDVNVSALILNALSQEIAEERESFEEHFEQQAEEEESVEESVVVISSEGEQQVPEEEEEPQVQELSVD